MSPRIVEATPSRRESQLIDEILSSAIGRLEAGLIVAADTVLEFLQGQRERAALMRLSDRELSDIGLTRSAVGNADGPRGLTD